MTEDMRPLEMWRDHLAAGKLMIQRSRSTGQYVFYPRIAAPGTGVSDLEWVEASGRGVVHAVTVVRKRPPEANYSVVLIDLEEGPRLMSEVVGIAPEDVRIDMAVHARIDQQDDGPRLVFVPGAE